MLAALGGHGLGDAMMEAGTEHTDDLGHGGDGGEGLSMS